MFSQTEWLIYCLLCLPMLKALISLRRPVDDDAAHRLFAPVYRQSINQRFKSMA